MKLFIDSADLAEIKLACSWGIIDGATTNPSLIKMAVDARGGAVTMKDYIAEILETVPGPVSLEVIALGAKDMVEQARKLYTVFSPHGDVAIKIPINTSLEDGLNLFDGLQAIKQLSDEHIPVNTTLIMTPEQALLAAKAGATYVSPFMGRIDDHIRTNLGLKRGVDYQRGDYYDPTPVQRIVAAQVANHASGATSASQIYRSKGLRELLAEGHDNGVYSGLDLVQRILRIYRAYDCSVKVIAASIRNTRQVRELAELGVHIATIPFSVLKDMIQHPKTLEGLRSFTADVVPAYAQLFE
jgi:transaldolase